MSAAVPTWAGVAASLALVAVAVAIAWRQRLQLAREIAVAAAIAALTAARLAERALFDDAHRLRPITVSSRGSRLAPRRPRACT